jgi:hypothetical protein
MNIFRIDTSQIQPLKPKVKKITLEQAIKELNKSQSLYTYCIKEKDIKIIIKKETNLKNYLIK